ncbi:MAG: class A beta-lactamase [Pseudomonadota bacterium]|nr:class A beta-lactamase [Pseudomonadota bacterium]
MRRLCATLAALALGSPALALDEAGPLAAVRAEEARLHARIGLAVIDKADGKVLRYRADERFPLNSTHKAFACAALLARADKGEASMQKRVVFVSTDLVPYSPVTENRIAPDAMSLNELCEAAVTRSDNTAANLVLQALGGPAGVTAFFRALGDATSRLDREEPDLNEGLADDPRDTTTPAAAAADLDRIVLGDALKPAARERLKQWMIGDRVAAALLRKALPEDWRIADKTGAGGAGSRGIVATIWPPQRGPFVVALYMTQTSAPLAERDAAIARIGAALVAAAR